MMKQIKQSECNKIVLSIYVPRGETKISLTNDAKFVLKSELTDKLYISKSLWYFGDEDCFDVSDKEEIEFIKEMQE